MQLRIRAPLGQEVIRLDDDASSIGDLLLAIESSKKLAPSGKTRVESIKVGFPPKTVAITNPEMQLKETGVASGDLLLVSFGSSPATGADAVQNEPKGGVSSAPVSNHASSPPTQSSTSSSIPSVPCGSKHLILRNIPDDNSCMFNALAYCLHGPDSYKPSGPCPPSKLRKIVADALADDPLEYNELVLGRPVEKYISWIQSKDAWGGAIELGILAKHLQIRINCIDIELGSTIRFQDESEGGKSPLGSILLVYLGVHYDVLAVNSILSCDHRADDVCKFAIDSEPEKEAETAARALCAKLQTQNYTTNTTRFRVRCLQCHQVLVGETGASRHANETGHYRFGEVKE